MAVTRWLVAALATLQLSCGRPADRLTELRGATMGTVYSVSIVDLPGRLPAQTLSGEIDAMLARINASMSTYLDDSELSRFNVSPGTDWVEVSPELLEVLEEAQRVSVMTGGAFDVTVGPLVNLWGFGPDLRRDVVPDEPGIAAARTRVGYGLLELRAQPPAARKTREDVYVDLSGIAKGYAADRVAAALDSHGLSDYVVAIGGELRVRGRNEENAPWTVAVARPLDGAPGVERLLRVGAAGISTSGDYRNYFDVDGHHYSHIIDPETGRPVTHDLASVTIIADTAMRADALATALMVLGPEAGYATAVRAGIAAIFIRRVGDRFVEQVTPVFEAYAVGAASAAIPARP